MTGSGLRLPAFRTPVAYHDTDGPEVGEMCALAGYPPDLEQQLLLDETFGFTKSGATAAFESCVIAPRQNLKTGFLKQCAIGWLFLSRVRLVLWSAHEFSTAQEAFRDMTELIEGTPVLAREIKAIHRGNGDEAIELIDNRRLMFKARTNRSGRGLTGDRTVLDEAFALKATHMGSLLPTMAARPDSQVVYASSAGSVESSVLRDLRDRGRKGDDPRLAYNEWCDKVGPDGCEMDGCDHSTDTPGCALDDRDKWAAANSALGRRITIGTLAALRRSMPPDEFAREFMGWWEDPLKGDEGAVNAAQWAETITTDAPTGVLSLAIDVAPGHTWSTIMVCGDGVLEMVDRRRGTGWLSDRLPQLCARHNIEQIGVDPAGPAGSILPELERLDVPLLLLDGKESVRACGAIAAAIADGAVHHRGESELLAAAGGAKRRPVGDGWKWSRKDSTVDISPLVAATIAHWLWLCRANEPIDPDLHFI